MLFGKKNDKENDAERAKNEIPAENPNVNTAGNAAETDPAQTAPANGAGEAQYVTPEGFDFNRYFLAERRVVLDNVSYETFAAKPGQFHLGVQNTIIAQVMGQAGVKITFNRTLAFEPEGPFRLSVTFGVMLVFNPGTRGEVDWRTIDVANEFKKNCPGLVEVMASKAALIVAELTEAGTGSPIILKK